MDEKTDQFKARGGRLARRAKSFKEDVLGKLNQMRSQSGTRSSSPSKGSKTKIKTVCSETDQCAVESRPVVDVETLLNFARLLSSALRYFQGVVQRNTFEMLPGCATVVLETVINIHSCLKEAVFDEQSSLMLSATSQVYQSLANLLRWSDYVLLHGELSKETEDVSNIVQALQDAIKALVQLSIDKLQSKENQSLSHTEGPLGNIVASPVENSHRKSLPDIPLTPREREILEQTKFPMPNTCSHILHHSCSSDNILGHVSHDNREPARPPPKPPLPDFRDPLSQSSEDHGVYSCRLVMDDAPPLPPKKRTVYTKHLRVDQSASCSDSELFDQSGTVSCESLCFSLGERTSPFSQSPDNLTPLSKSSASSLDSNLDCFVEDTTISRHTHYSCCSQNITQKCLQDSIEVFPSLCVTSTTKVISESSSSSVIYVSEGMHEETSTKISERINHLTTSKETLISDAFPKNSVLPPALPTKLKTMKKRVVSQYDNVPQLLVSSSDDISDDFESFSLNSLLDVKPEWTASKHDPTCPHHVSYEQNGNIGMPPPLPPKRKTVMAYMQMFGSYTQPSQTEFLHQSAHTYHILQTNWQTEFTFQSKNSFSSSFIGNSEDSLFGDSTNSYLNAENQSNMKNGCTISSPPALPPKKSKPGQNTCIACTLPTKWSPSSAEKVYLPKCNYKSDKRDAEKPLNSPQNDEVLHSEANSLGALEEPDASEYIIYKSPGEDGPDIRGGTIDSLIVQATKATKNDFLYQEAFLTTYRTFIAPLDLVRKLLCRYNKFIYMSDMRQRAARNAFALLIRVVDDMCIADIQIDVLSLLMDFVFQLVSRGELILARALRKKVVEKCEARQRCLLNTQVLLPSMAISTRQASLIDFKSEYLAEQMTVLDADLFQKIEIPEVLLWAKEQKEDLSPNLTKFTEHFNKMSYWARSRILEQEEAKDREKYVVKFIKMMKYLRKLNNFNSYLAILSALDSAPIRRLEWQRNITEGLKEYCALIDSSSSFRAYRQALAETSSPCIPYIGLILQDLTFVHIGNSDLLGDSVVNFSKRWQQFNILDNMRRFRNSQYPFRRNEEIIAFFNNFDDYLCEEAMWQISETIKPRGGRKKGFEES